MGITEYDRQQVQRLLTQEGQVKYLFDKFVRQAGMYLSNYKAGATVRDERDVWIRNTAIEKKIERLLDDLHGDLMRNIENNASVSWKAANAKTDNIIKAYIKDLALSETATQGMFARNAEALNAFLKRKVGGLTVSERVWKTTESAKADLEYYLSSGLATGRPAGLISQDIRQLLQNPDKRFRRVRDESGRLVMSKPMMNYHPGQGVYRSAYKNALRVAATETNMAYHEADAERWSRLDFVTGVKVSRSNSNRGPCAVCDALVGTYPKGFKFLPWHPFCICFAVPVMLEGDEFVDYLVKGESDEGKGESGKYIKEMPAGALEFFGKNAVMQGTTAYLENKRWFADENVVDLKISAKAKEQEIIFKDKLSQQRRSIMSSFEPLTISNDALIEEVKVSKKSAKEWLNQPHKHIVEKNDLLKKIKDVFKDAIYCGSGIDKHNMSVKVHLFEIEFAGEKSWIVVREIPKQGYKLHSISDSEDILKYIKNKP